MMQDSEKSNSKARNEKPGKASVNGIRIRNLNYIFLGVLLISGVVLFIVSSRLTSGYRELIQTTDEYHRIEADARMVQAASDDLTRDAQLFVMTGRKSYLDSYFLEAQETRRRENAIDDLEKLQATDSLIELLESSVRESMNLMLLEYEAMRYAAKGYGYDISELPEEVQAVQLPAAADNMTAAELIDKAEEIAFGESYAGYKSRIRGYERQFLEKAILLMDEKQEEKRTLMEKNILIQRIGVALILVVGVTFFFTILVMVVYPLNHAVSSISGASEITPIRGTYEIRYMSHTYNEYHRHSMELQMNLKRDAERDELTGVLNRRGYQMVIDRLKKESFPVGFLLVDVDDFKDVNDNYGHAMGDLALKRVARLLVNTFRETDITSRIGGDEFTVIMSDITKENKGAVEQKINVFNQMLKTQSPDGCPPLSVSVGCVFSSSDSIEEIFVNADRKMYEIKEAGGNSIGFV